MVGCPRGWHHPAKSRSACFTGSSKRSVNLNNKAPAAHKRHRRNRPAHNAMKSKQVRPQSKSAKPPKQAPPITAAGQRIGKPAVICGCSPGRILLPQDRARMIALANCLNYISGTLLRSGLSGIVSTDLTPGDSAWLGRFTDSAVEMLKDLGNKVWPDPVWQGVPYTSPDTHSN